LNPAGCRQRVDFHIRGLGKKRTGSCSQILQNTPLYPITEWGRQRFGGADIPAEQRLADLENTLTQVKFNPAESIPLLAPLLDNH
jgi:hypothetical protein